MTASGNILSVLMDLLKIIWPDLGLLSLERMEQKNGKEKQEKQKTEKK